METTACPEPKVWRPFVLGELPAPEQEQLGKHLTTCAHCVALLQDMTQKDPLLAATRVQEATPLHPTIPAPKLPPGQKANVPTAEYEFHLNTTQIRPAIEQTAAFPNAAHPFFRPPEAPGEIGRLGSYRVLKPLGEGGGGLVYLAEDVMLQRRVALKVLKPEVAQTAHAAERFLREARAAAAIEHEHVIPIHQVGEDGGVFYLAMQLLHGETLQDRLLRDARMSQEEVLRIGREIASGLDAAHARGLIHRDIKPANVWLEAETGRVKILDFGMARHSEETQRFTRVGFVVGTPAYMSPEQAQDLAVGPTSDLFSLGTLLYQMLTAQQPFYRPTLQSTMAALVVEQPAPPHELNQETSSALSDLVMWLLAKNPLDRPGSAQAVIEALEAIESGKTGKRRSQPITFGRSPLAGKPMPGVGQYLIQALLFVVTACLVTLIALRLTVMDGEIVFQADDPAIDMTALVEKGKVILYDLSRNRRVDLEGSRQPLPVGEYRLEAGAPDLGLIFEPPSFKIERGKKTIIKVRQDKKSQDHI
jgi:tRNA A-37 threonylcarbamoyl transferase component Bud32